MSKKFKKLTKLEERIWKEIERERTEIENVYNQFFIDGVIQIASFPGIAEGYYDERYCCCIEKMNGMPEDERTQWNRIIAQKCMEIRRNIQDGRNGNVEIDFDEGTIQCTDSKYKLGNTIVKCCNEFFGDDIFFMKAGDKWKARIFIGGAPKEALLLLESYKDSNASDGDDDDCDDGEGVDINLEEVYLLGMCSKIEDKNDTGKDSNLAVEKADRTDVEEEIGIMVRYSWEELSGSCKIIRKPDVQRIKELVLSEYLEKQWDEYKKKNE